MGQEVCFDVLGAGRRHRRRPRRAEMLAWDDGSGVERTPHRQNDSPPFGFQSAAPPPPFHPFHHSEAPAAHAASVVVTASVAQASGFGSDPTARLIAEDIFDTAPGNPFSTA